VASDFDLPRLDVSRPAPGMNGRPLRRSEVDAAAPALVLDADSVGLGSCSQLPGATSPIPVTMAYGRSRAIIRCLPCAGRWVPDGQWITNN
jgi:hypothetical protein